MHISRITAYNAELSYAGGTYSYSHGTLSTFRTAVVVIETNRGHQGYGEVCPCGPIYMPAYAEGFLPALKLLAPALIGLDPTQTKHILGTMDATLNGSNFVKTAIDLACWDILGKVARLPVYKLLGGKLNEAIPIHRVVPLADIDATLNEVNGLRKRGIHHFQIKMGGHPEHDIARIRAIAETRQPGEILVGDANTALRRDEIIRISNQLRDVDFYIEQPCREYQEHLAIKHKLHHPLKLDENLQTVADFQQALRDDLMEAAAIKLSKFGGLTRSRIIRDICEEAGIALTIEEAWGSGIASAASAHLAISTAPEVLLNGTDIHNYNSNQIATGQPEVENGKMTVSDRPGLGVEPLFEALGEPVYRS
jgi:L-alanine-DL-glutamate epimerase-like enolase superfamily enzyme